ncbi:hypothetical protein E2E30_00710 [Sphingomonas sp. AAP5]|jgi:outer membrane lipoprotein SlyB|uniref:17 kDa surface antigen n=1 Tax=Sphingomonas glacialis TaxID=658225 RepID=A0ABQ3LLJ3_9SPHN|nr:MULTISPECIES: hypothetical protein [Sphingomonas]MDY7524767.1 hypothetical protein [Sphingomonas sp. 10B4]MEB0281246.1 hypothetical protein [Sphingomonas sp. 10B4]QBM74428.1 hypothetical protein E2E30_00710 [Sphingomonas sp. AAP5]GHH14869.1 hypothetical protein GCM10008023_17040 [Sphingomonas glacialis]
MRHLFLSLAAASLVIPATMALPTDKAEARKHRYYGKSNRHYSCRRSSGTTGLLVGGAGGALAGNALGGGVLGTVAGGVGGALLGKHLDKRHDAAQNRRNGC